MLCLTKRAKKCPTLHKCKCTRLYILRWNKHNLNCLIREKRIAKERWKCQFNSLIVKSLMQTEKWLLKGKYLKCNCGVFVPISDKINNHRDHLSLSVIIINGYKLISLLTWFKQIQICRFTHLKHP